MIYIENNSRDAAYNLALEEYLLSNYKNGDILMLWINSPSIIAGKFQNVYEEVSLLRCDRREVGIFRRNSGGGTVYHDDGNVNFTLISDKGEESPDYGRFLTPVVDFLRSLGVAADIDKTNALTAGNMKISGNAQTVAGGRTMHHGTLLYDADLGALTALTGHARDKITSKSIKSRPSPVCNIKPLLARPMTTDEFVERLKIALCGDNFDSHALTDDEKTAVNRIADEKYRTDEWNLLRSPAFELSSERFGFKLKVAHGIVESVTSNSANCPVNLLTGEKLILRDVTNKLSQTLTQCEADEIINEIFD